MQYCHQSYCDGLDMLNADNLYYLTFIADSLIRTVAELTGSKCMLRSWTINLYFLLF